MKTIVLLYSALAALSVTAAPAAQDSHNHIVDKHHRRSHHHHHSGEKKRACTKKDKSTDTFKAPADRVHIDPSIYTNQPAVRNSPPFGQNATSTATGPAAQQTDTSNGQQQPDVQAPPPNKQPDVQPPPPPPAHKPAPDVQAPPPNDNLPSNAVSGGLHGEATTTLYYDGSGGACGCFDQQSKVMFPWQSQTQGNFYTAAVNEYLYYGGGTPTGGAWCGAGCGKCYQLTSRGHAACQDCGLGSTPGEQITIMATNLCPESSNYCAGYGSTNQFGIKAHFDIMAPLFKLEGKMWDNPVVDYVEIACPEPYASQYTSCQCSKKG